MMHPDYVVFFGMLETGIPLVRQIQAMKEHRNTEDKTSWNPVILLSDGSVDKEIEGYAQKDELKDIRGFFPHGLPLTPNAQDLDSSSAGSLDHPSFTMFGYDAAIFAHQILQAAISENPTLDRKNVAKALHAVQTQWNRGDPSTDHVLVGSYKFDDYGDPSGLKYHVWIFDGSTWVCKTDQDIGR
jgi:hypothetical protein